MKNYQELSQKYFKKEDQIEDVRDALMLILSNVSDIQEAIENDECLDDAYLKLDSLKEFVSDLRAVEK
jgi:hypothetical protein